ncbi:MAG TPA: alpha/beta hydrolase [Steroidobacteraceae bacterium]|jgi:pimeloyl-ACP methyl ester carboxylesterase|nr:alpha/beta hydrolase [Steroidobacteraceae bacterium]
MKTLFAAALALASTWTLPAGAAATVHYHTSNIDGVNVFYREAGPADAPAIVLLHGFPTSSNMFRNLIPALADRYHVIAPDYPGFGQSEMPERTKFQYSFAHFADITDTLLTRLAVPRYALYVMDYGAPVGYRLALKHPERVTALVIQNGNAYEEGLGDFWKPIKAYWASGQPAQRDALREGTTLAATRSQYLGGVADPSRVDPSAWVLDQALLDRPGNVEIQLDLFYDYRTNLGLYPQFQKFFRERQPPALIVWGKNDVIFPAPGARAYLKDLPHAELHLLDTGHFALEDQGDEIARLMRAFLDRTLPHS